MSETLSEMADGRQPVRRNRSQEVTSVSSMNNRVGLSRPTGSATLAIAPGEDAGQGPDNGPTESEPTGNGSRPSGVLRTIGWPLWLLVAAFIAWWLGLRAVSPQDMGGLGLFTELSVPTVIAYPLVMIAGVGELRRPERRGSVLALVTLAALVMIYGLAPAVESAARLPVPWLHAGFTEYIADNGSVLADYDARFSWPGFFAAAAFIGRAAGVSDVTPLLAWSPLVFAGLAVLAFRALAVSVFKDRPVGWIATWVFLLANWTEQDYFSPQATAVVLLIGALAVTLRYLVRPGIIEGGRVRLTARPVPNSSPRNRIWAQLFVVAMAAALAPTHQLTPYVLVGMLLVLLLWGRLNSGWLPVLAFTPVVAWFVLGAKPFWVTQLDRITGSVGRVDSSVSQGIAQRLAGDAGHQFIVAARIGITVAVALMACAGLIVLRRRGVRTWVLPVLAASAFGLVLLQPYGGEVFVRSYLFALPWFAIGASIALDALLRPAAGGSTDLPAERPTGSSRVKALLPATAVATIMSLLALTTVAVRDGNDAYVSMTTADVDAMQFVYASAESGDTVVAPIWYSVLRSSRIGDLRQIAAVQLKSAENACDTPESMVTCIADADVDFVVVNSQQESAGQILEGFPAGWLTKVVAELEQTHGYVTVFDRDGALVLAPAGSTP